MTKQDLINKIEWVNKRSSLIGEPLTQNQIDLLMFVFKLSDQEPKPSVINCVSVSDRLPKIGDLTDVYISTGHRVTNYKWEDHDLQSSFMPHEITHWISIPDPI